MSEAIPVLGQLNLVVSDMEATLAFYRLLGLDIPTNAGRTGGGHHVEVALSNGFVLEFDSSELAKSYNAGSRPPGGGGAVIGFSVPSREAVDACYARLIEAGHAGMQEPYDTFWGARYAVVADPDGHHVGIMSPLDPARRSAPPALS